MATDNKSKKPAPKRDEPLSLYGMTPEQAIAKAFQSPPIKKNTAKPAPPKRPAK